MDDIMEKLDGKSFNVVEDNISKLKEIFPEVINGDNQVDFDNLREILEKDIEVVDDTEEHYKFTWWGKKEAKRVALESTTKTLRPSKNDSKDWDTTENIYIEGDNLDALKILLGSYRNRIKMIYIDPPYNTGHDFVYKDNRTETSEEHLANTNQLSEEGYLYENPKTDGKYHSNWLNMMYPRLYLAKRLLTDQGILFISINDYEIENLNKMADEIFGEDNVEIMIWEKVTGSENAGSGKMKITKRFRKDHEYILVCYKSKEKTLFNKPLRIKKTKNQYGNADNDPRGNWMSCEICKSENKSNPNGKNYFEVTTPTGKKISRQWHYSYEELVRLDEDNRIYWGNGNIIPRLKKFLNEPSPTTPSSVILGMFTQTGANNELKELDLNFDNPKPVDLIKWFLEFSESDDDIILDFFSGSSTTAQSTMKLNSEDNGHRKFIMVQLPEETDEKSDAYKAGYKNICEIGKERIRRAGEKILEEANINDLDIGFKVFKIDESNFIPWNPDLNSTEDIEQAILATANNIVDGRSELDLVYELLLKLNLDLNAKIDEKQINNNKFYIVNHGFMMICLNPNVDVSIAEDIINLKEELMTEYCQVVLLDKALDDNSSRNIYETLNSQDIEFYTI